MFLDTQFDVPAHYFLVVATIHHVEPSYAFIMSKAETRATEEEAEELLEEWRKAHSILHAQILPIQNQVKEETLREQALQRIDEKAAALRAETQKELTGLAEFRQSLLSLTHQEY
ncbi:hypothetical protein [Idiomarina abyssalis]|uniref:hypothetical protein n=1 Tax=Idiomarina abyssalis TaxID=86102 RepID=UPI003A905BAA